MINLKTNLIIGAAALIIGGLVAGVTVWNIRGTQIDLLTAQHDKALAESKLVASKAERELSDYKLDFEKSLGETKDEVQQNFNKSLATINKSIADLAGRRLQDPHANRDSSASNNPDSPSGSDGSDPGTGALSEQASQFLFGFTGEADATLERLRACRVWNNEVEAKYAAYKANVDEMIRDLEKQGLIKIK